MVAEARGSEMKQFCPNPFEWLDLTAWNEGRTVKLAMCLSCWGGDAVTLAIMPLSDAANVDIMRLWNSPHARNARQHLAAGEPADFCRECSRWKSCIVPVRFWSTEDGLRPIVNDGPKVLNLAYDRSCNLACPSCRLAPIRHMPGTEWHRQIKAFQDGPVRRLLRTADRAFLAGMGDPFGSPLYWELLTTLRPEDAPCLKWHFQTNGHGFTEENYQAILTHPQIDSVQFSLDAATEATYRVNRGAGWRHVMQNLEFVARLRKAGRLNRLSISMVVQENNYREIPAFVALGERMGADMVQLNPLHRLRAYTDAEHQAAAVHLEGHPDHTAMMQAIKEAERVHTIEVLVEMSRRA
jgi:pyruvate-formate lyase-activating enzyme